MAPYKFYVNFGSLLQGVQSNDKNNNTSYTKKYQKNIPCSFAYKVVCVIINLVNQLFFTEEKMQQLNLLKEFLKCTVIAKK